MEEVSSTFIFYLSFFVDEAAPLSEIMSMRLELMVGMLFPSPLDATSSAQVADADSGAAADKLGIPFVAGHPTFRYKISGQV